MAPTGDAAASPPRLEEARDPAPPDPAWTSADYVRFLRSPEAGVHAWALSALARFWPADAAAEVSRILREGPAEDMVLACDVGVGLPPADGDEERIAPLFRHADARVRFAAIRWAVGREAGSLADAMLESTRDGDPLVRRAAWAALAMLDRSRARALLVERPEPEGWPALAAVAEPEDAPVLVDRLRRAREAGEGEDIESLFARWAAAEEAYKRIGERPEEGIEEPAVDVDALWVEWQREFPGPAEGEAPVLVAVREMFGRSRALLRAGTEAGVLASAGDPLARALRTVAARFGDTARAFRRASTLEELWEAAADAPALIRGFVIESIGERWDRDEVAPEERGALLAALLRAVGAGGAPGREPAFSLWRRVCPAGGAWRLIEALGDADRDVVEWLADRVDEWLGGLEERLPRLGRWPAIAAARAMGQSGRRSAAEFLADHLGAFEEREAADEAVSALVHLAWPPSVDAMLRRWRPGEEELAGAICTIADLGGAGDRVPAEVRKEAEAIPERYGQAVKRMKEAGGDLEKMTKVYAEEVRLRLALRCRGCGRTFRYDVPRAFVSPERFLGAASAEGSDWDGCVLGRVIRCKECGMEDDYALTQGARRDILMGLVAAGARPADALGRGVYAGGLCLFDGTRVERPAQALRHLRGLIEKSPRDAVLWRRLGNEARHMGEEEEAIRAYRRALELDEGELEAAYGLFCECFEHGRSAEMFKALNEFLMRLGKGKADPEMRRRCVGSVLEFLRVQAEMAPGPLPLSAMWLAGHTGGRPIVKGSTVDLRRVKRWDRLTDLLASERLQGAFLGGDTSGDDEGPSLLEQELEREIGESAAPDWIRQGDVGGAEPASGGQEGVRVGRNEPCSCGTGRKHKKCCGR